MAGPGVEPSLPAFHSTLPRSSPGPHYVDGIEASEEEIKAISSAVFLSVASRQDESGSSLQSSDDIFVPCNLDKCFLLCASCPQYDHITL